MAVRAMFTLDEKIQTRDGFRLKFSAVVGDSELAERYFKWTPYGTLEMGTVNADAAAQFEPGKSYYLDFSAVEDIGRPVPDHASGPR